MPLLPAPPRPVCSKRDGWQAPVTGAAHTRLVEKRQKADGKSNPGRDLVSPWEDGSSVRRTGLTATPGPVFPFSLWRSIVPNVPLCLRLLADASAARGQGLRPLPVHNTGGRGRAPLPVVHRGLRGRLPPAAAVSGGTDRGRWIPAIAQGGPPHPPFSTA